jgi:hypothetical protein
LDLHRATARQVQQLRFVDFASWFPPQRDERASERFYTVLQEDFYIAYVRSRARLRVQRVCSLEAIVAAGGERV